MEILQSLATARMFTAPQPCVCISLRLTAKIASLEVTTVFKKSPPCEMRLKMNYVQYRGYGQKSQLLYNKELSYRK